MPGLFGMEDRTSGPFITFQWRWVWLGLLNAVQVSWNYVTQNGLEFTVYWNLAYLLEYKRYEPKQKAGEQFLIIYFNLFCVYV